MRGLESSMDTVHSLVMVLWRWKLQSDQVGRARDSLQKTCI